MQASKETSGIINAFVMPTVGDMYDHATGVYKVDWVCGCGDYDDGETCIGLLGDTMTWTGNVSDLSSAGFTKHARDTRVDRQDFGCVERKRVNITPLLDKCGDLCDACLVSERQTTERAKKEGKGTMKAEFYTVRGYDETGARTTRKVLANSHTQHSPYETRLNGLRRSGEETIAGLRATCKQVVVVVGGREVGIEN